MTEPAIPCGSCGQPATTVVVVHGCIVEKCHPCAKALCDPLSLPRNALEPHQAAAA